MVLTEVSSEGVLNLDRKTDILPRVRPKQPSPRGKPANQVPRRVISSHRGAATWGELAAWEPAPPWGERPPNEEAS